METDVSTTPLTHESYERIKKDILTGIIPSGSVLSERALAERYKLSRTPLRVALSALESEGVIERLAQGTALVRHVSLEQFFDIVEMRRVIEVETASRAARYPITSELAELEELLRARDERSFEVFWNEDTRFHTGVARAARMPMTLRILSRLRETARRCTIVHSFENFSDRLNEHLAVITAIRDHDPEAARSAMESHFDGVRARYLNSLTNG